jgi:integrase
VTQLVEVGSAHYAPIRCTSSLHDNRRHHLLGVHVASGKSGHHDSLYRPRCVHRGDQRRPAPAIMYPAVGGVERLDDSNVRKVFTRISAAAKVRLRSPHDLRATYASTLLSMNAPLLYVAEQLGHGRIGEFLND